MAARGLNEALDDDPGHEQERDGKHGDTQGGVQSTCREMPYRCNWRCARVKLQSGAGKGM
jgi:hypothetical protein